MIPPPPPVFYGPPPRPWWVKLGRVLWVSVPAVSLGFLAWLPPLRNAIRRQTFTAWGWFAGYLGASVMEVILANAFQTKDAQGNGTITDPVGVYVLVLMAVGSVHAGLMTRVGNAPAPVGYLHGFGHRHGYGYDGYGGLQGGPGPTQPMGGYALYQQTYDQVPPPGISPLPPPLDGDAAEVQAGLRELRESLERGEER